MSGYDIEGVRRWALAKAERSEGAEFEMYSCIADAIALYMDGRGCFACDEHRECMERRSALLAVADMARRLSDGIRIAYGLRPIGGAAGRGNGR